MWKCHKCGKPVYFAERKQSLGYNWHPECLRCEECGKRLNPGQHAEHKGVPYCHVPCYGALFGPQLFGHGTRVESHKSFGLHKESPKSERALPRSHLESKLKVYNQYFEGKSAEIRSREVNGRLVLEGSVRIHWGVQGVIHLKENDDQRTVVTVRKRNSCRLSASSLVDSDDDVECLSRDTSCDELSSCSNATLNDPTHSDTGIDTATSSWSDTSTATTPDNSPSTPPLPKSVTLPSRLDVRDIGWDELDELLRVERKLEEAQKPYRTMPEALPSQGRKENVAVGDGNGSSSLSSPDSPHSAPNGFYPADSDHGDTPLLSPEDTGEDRSWLSLSTNTLNRSMSGPDCLGRLRREPSRSPDYDRLSIAAADLSTASEPPPNREDSEVVVRRPAKTVGANAIRRRPGKRLSRSKVKRRCSINGHFYDRETSFFTPPHGSQMSVWVTSLVSTQEVINLMLEKYKVDSDPSNFALFVVRDNGEQRRLKDDEYPLLVRVLIGPHEDVVKLFLMDGHNTPEVSSEVAQFLNLSLAECRAILNQYYSQEEREVARIKEKYLEMKRRIICRINELKPGS